MAAVKGSGTIGILAFLFIVLPIGLSISVASQHYSKGRELRRDDHYILYRSGVVSDTKTGLDWKSFPDTSDWKSEPDGVTWYEAKQWVDNLKVAGGGWRMPTVKELETLYDKGRARNCITRLLYFPGTFAWSVEIRRSPNDPPSAWGFGFHHFCGCRQWGVLNEKSEGSWALAVRSSK